MILNGLNEKITSDDDVIVNGHRVFSDKRQITLYCEDKKVIVSAPLTNDIQTSITNKWSDFFQSGVLGGTYNILGTIDKALNAWNGTSIHQPYMSRKMWEGTNPLSFSLDLNFIAESDAETEVMQPIKRLVTMATPRVAEAIEGSALDSLQKQIESVMSQGETTRGKQANKFQKGMVKLTKGLVDTIKIISQRWVSPGPAVFPVEDDGSNTIQESSPITIYIPSFGTLNNCYIESLSISTSKSTDINGMPLGAKVNVKITKMDAIFCVKQEDDSYSVDWNQNYENDSLTSISTTLNKIGYGLVEFAGGTYVDALTLLSGGDINSDFEQIKNKSK